MRLTPTLSDGSSLSCQLSAAGLHSAAANISSKRSSTNFSTSSDNVESVNCISADVDNASAVDVTERQAARSLALDSRRQFPSTTSLDDVINEFPVGSGRLPERCADSDTRHQVEQLAVEVDTRTRPTSDHVTRLTSATVNGDSKRPLSEIITRRSGRPPTWCFDGNDVILSSLHQRDDVDRGVITSTP